MSGYSTTLLLSTLLACIVPIYSQDVVRPLDFNVGLTERYQTLVPKNVQGNRIMPPTQTPNHIYDLAPSVGVLWRFPGDYLFFRSEFAYNLNSTNKALSVGMTYSFLKMGRSR